MIRLTSNSTLFFKIFLPIFYTVFYGFFAGWILFSTPPELADYPWLPYVNLAFYLLMIAGLWLTVFRLMRIDCGPDHFVVTNYHTARQYTYDSVASLRVQRFLMFRLGRLVFHEQTHFGHRLTCLINVAQLEKITEAYGMVWPIEEVGS